MKRSSFMKISIAAFSSLTVPLVGFAKKKQENRTNKSFKVDAGKDRFDKAITLFEGDTFYTKVSTKDTDSDLYIFESSRIKKGGPALHFHYNQDEWWYVLEGEFLIKVGDRLYEVKAGDSVFGPRGVPHAFAKTGEGNARLLMTFQPAGKMEEFFIAASEGKLAKMTPAEQDDFKKQHGFEHVGPALNYQKGL
jgi:mannose-6-phosphate isomerase-like protein (cupin superfamily)